jgi:hypothetical protein
MRAAELASSDPIAGSVFGTFANVRLSAEEFENEELEVAPLEVVDEELEVAPLEVVEVTVELPVVVDVEELRLK